MHSSERQAALKKVGYSQARLAAELEVGASTVNGTIVGRTRSQRVEQRIAELTGYSLHQLWPEWYEPPSGAVQASATGGVIDTTMLGIIEQHLDRELMRRVPDLEVPFTVRIRHVAMVYNGVVARKPRADQVLDVIAEETQRYVDFHDDPEGPGLKRVFLRDFSGAQAAIAKERASAPRTVITSGSVGKQVNLTGDGQTLVMGKRAKKKTK